MFNRGLTRWYAALGGIVGLYLTILAFGIGMPGIVSWGFCLVTAACVVVVIIGTFTHPDSSTGGGK